MAVYPKTNILIKPLDKENIRKLDEIKTYLEINGSPNHQNCDNLDRKEYHYFMGNSDVLIKEHQNKANIEIIASGQTSLNIAKRNIKTILDKD